MRGLKGNAFTTAVLGGVREQEALRDTSLRPVGNGWVHNPTPARVSPPALLQGRSLAAEVTDHGALLLPFSSPARLAVDVIGYRSAGGREYWIRPGSAERRGGDGHTVWTIHPEEPVVIIEFIGEPGPTSLRFAAGTLITAVANGLWLDTPDHPLIRPDVTHNNSRVPDPVQPALPRHGMFVAALSPSAAVTPIDLGWSSEETSALLVDCERPTSRATVIPETGAIDRLLLVAAHTPEEGSAVVDRVRTDLRSPGTPLPIIDLPDDALTRQLAFAVANSLAARARTPSGDVFVHGRRDRGYADVGHLHQSYAMHTPALAAGESRSVRDDLLAYLRLQDPDGGIRRAPRPGPGAHPYVGTYTNGHVPLVLERYLSWTDDRSILSALVGGETVLSRCQRSMQWLLDNAGPDGLVAPCGWLDAWNPEVVAQGQTSLLAVLGWRALARILDWAGEPGADEATANAEALLAAVRRRLYDPSTGIVAENLLADGAIEGGGINDFFAHTQLWAVLADDAADQRGLDLVRERCWGTGVAVVAESALERDYFGDSTDGADSLTIDSTATWLLASWPELTHLFALELARHEEPDLALQAVHRQSPTTIHRSNPDALPYYYAEKYLSPGDHPWLCTWAGDPTLVEVVLHGFFGLHVGLGTVEVRPSWPSSWRGFGASARFKLRGDQWLVQADPALPAGLLEVDHRAHPGGPLDTAPGSPHSVRFGVGRREV